MFDPNTIDFISRIATTIGVLVACFALIMNYRSLKANNTWHRNNNAIKLLEKWNPETSKHRQAIEKAFPHLVDMDHNKRVEEISPERANKIYSCEPTEPEWELRFHIVELLNYFELVAASYLCDAADKRTIERSLKNTMTRYYRILHHFITVVKEHRGYNPWGPYLDLVESWQNGKP